MDNPTLNPKLTLGTQSIPISLLSHLHVHAYNQFWHSKRYLLPSVTGNNAVDKSSVSFHLYAYYLKSVGRRMDERMVSTSDWTDIKKKKPSSLLVVDESAGAKKVKLRALGEGTKRVVLRGWSCCCGSYILRDFFLP